VQLSQQQQDDSLLTQQKVRIRKRSRSKQQQPKQLFGLAQQDRSRIFFYFSC